jgi:transcription elongation factor Elf1
MKRIYQHLYAKEVVLHFICGKCEQSWTISEPVGKLPKKATCPWCGTKAKVEDAYA